MNGYKLLKGVRVEFVNPHDGQLVRGEVVGFTQRGKRVIVQSKDRTLYIVNRRLLDEAK